ncbi:penicillin-binding protein activator LpoB [Salinibacter sp. 10B]|uniref:penicillin-binding protein activator LpoB n=1 Tax=Salinibacter sp. 10B TaxID=1923971 RepID=UPI000CF57209|nr:penicillin-binding protein activator LpoB [Salinibacter sp. 10B]
MTRPNAMLGSLRISSFLLFALCLFVACGPSRTTTRVSPDQQTDLSGRWNETDAKMVVDEMIGGMLESAWLQRWNQEHDDRPTLIIGPIRNKTMQHIDEEIFIKDIERNLVNSGKVRFVAAADEREALRAEREDQQTHATMESAAQMAQEVGADYMVYGTISSNVQENLEGDKSSLFYTVNLELLNIESNVKAWLNEKEIKKIVERSKASL